MLSTLFRLMLTLRTIIAWALIEKYLIHLLNKNKLCVALKTENFFSIGTALEFHVNYL